MNSTTPLGKVVDVSAGQPAPKPNEFSDEGYPFIRAGSLQSLLNGGTEQDCEKIDQEIAEKNRFRLYPKDTILFAKSGMSAKIGRVYRLGEPSFVVSHLAALKPTGKYDPSYLTYWLRKNPPSKLIKDDAYPSIRLPDIASLEVPDLKLDEQRRIAAILDKADDIRRKREQALSLAEDFLRSLFLDMFGDPVTNSKGWNRRPFNELANIDTNMVDPKREPYIDLLHIGPDVIEKKTGVILPAKTARQEGVRSGKYLFDSDHILYTKIRPYLQKVALPTFEGICSADVYPIRAIQGMATKEFLWSVLISPAYLAYFDGLPDRANIPKINMKEMNAYQCIAPPIEEQERFSDAMRKVMASVKNLERSLQESSDLFASLSQRAFRGEL